ncbi:hypothetical protein [Xenorhabdus sp. KJ12.1]|uniref:hypothetical protein n=1 Tax=Xenorhabdus sp. KJ12.1 TaxID=1851571 RepID=UPI000C051DD2|nr:hypothetical protein [Xenorhabdus sp. KJ12.1]PHM68100.1 hypothetical protein Xekj_03596 [Xenorhabdus sp. KJ12.1]
MKSKKQKNDQESNIKGLNKFQIYLTSGNKEDSVYANGKMQIGIRILIRAVNDSDKQVILSDEQLESIKLINYSTGKELSNGWIYNDRENKYNHVFPNQSSQEIFYSLHEENKDDIFQHKIYWVTTSHVEEMQIGAQIKLNGKTYNTLAGTSFDSRVIVIGYQPITYNSDDLIIEKPEHITSGKYKFNVVRYIPNIETLSNDNYYYKWSQTNYYIKSKNGFKIKDAYVWKTVNNDEPSNMEFRRFSYLVNQDNLYLFFIWGTYQEKNKLVGHPDISKSVTDTPHDFYPSAVTLSTGSPQVHLDILNPHSDVVSITKLYFESPQEYFWETEKSKSDKPNFYFHDVYGNRSGHMRVIINKDNQSFYLQDADND